MKRFVLFLLVLTVLGGLLLFALPLLGLSAMLPAVQQGQEGGEGGAYGTTSQIVTPPRGMILGGSGPGGTCVGTAGPLLSMIHIDFGVNSTLSARYQNDQVDQLCNDHYIWLTSQTLPVSKVLSTLQWPTGLLKVPAANQAVVMQPISLVDPNTQQALANQNADQNQTQPLNGCDWVPDLVFAHPHIDLCAPLRMLIAKAAEGIRSLYQQNAAQLSFLWQTPTQPFQDPTSGLAHFWMNSWTIVTICLSATIAYASFRFMLGSVVSWLAYANLMEIIPRILLALLAAFFSRQFFLMLISANNALAALFNTSMLTSILNTTFSGTVNNVLQIFYGILGFLLIAEEAVRLAVLYLLFAFSPMLFFFASLRETERLAQSALVATIAFIFLQAIQAACLDVGNQMLTMVIHDPNGHLSFLNLLVSIAIIYLVLTLFFSIARLAFGGGGSLFGAGVSNFSTGLPALAGGLVGSTLGGVLGGGFHIGKSLIGSANPNTSRKSGRSGNRSGRGNGSGGPGNGSGGRSGGNGGSGRSGGRPGGNGGRPSGGRSGSSGNSGNGRSGNRPGGKSGNGGRPSGGGSGPGRSSGPDRSGNRPGGKNGNGGRRSGGGNGSSGGSGSGRSGSRSGGNGGNGGRRSGDGNGPGGRNESGRSSNRPGGNGGSGPSKRL